MGLELLWRGWTHKAMFFAGGTCFLLLGQLKDMPPWFKALAGAGVEMIANEQPSQGRGRGVRLKEPAQGS